MDSLGDINKKIKSSSNIKKIVSTMKALSMTNIRIYGKAIESIFQYKGNVELGIQAIISQNPDIMKRFCKKKKGETKPTKDIIIVCGSNQGLCGKFNDKIWDFFHEDIKNLRLKKENYSLFVVGNRLDILAEIHKIKSDIHLSMPNILEETTDAVYQILNKIEETKQKNHIGKILLYYIEYNDVASNGLTKKQLLPIDEQFLNNLKQKVWPTKVIPFWRVANETLFSDFIKQYLFINLYYILASSIMSEQKYRMASLKNAEDNIADLIQEMQLDYNQRKQNSVTSEMLDIITGYNMIQEMKN